MATLSTGPMWRLVVEAMGPVWCAQAEAERPLRDVTLALDGDRLVATGTPVGGRMDGAWWLTVALGELVAEAEAPDTVGALVRARGLTVEVPGAVLAGVAAGQGRRWWGERVEARVG